MCRMLTFCSALLAGILLLVPPRALANPLILLAPAPSDVLRLIDSLTKNDSETTVNVKFGKTVTQGKLLVARSKVDVALERSSRNWRGKVVVQMVVPSEITYSVDLAEIRAEHIRLDTNGNRLVIKMPRLRVEDVTPALSSVESDSDFKGARWKFLDRNTVRELQNSMLLHDYQARARQLGEENIRKIREQGRQGLEKFLRKLLGGSSQRVRVVVE